MYGPFGFSGGYSFGRRVSEDFPVIEGGVVGIRDWVSEDTAVDGGAGVFVAISRKAVVALEMGEGTFIGLFDG